MSDYRAVRTHIYDAGVRLDLAGAFKVHFVPGKQAFCFVVGIIAAANRDSDVAEKLFPFILSMAQDTRDFSREMNAPLLSYAM